MTTKHTGETPSAIKTAADILTGVLGVGMAVLAVQAGAAGADTASAVFALGAALFGLSAVWRWRVHGREQRLPDIMVIGVGDVGGMLCLATALLG